MICSVAFTHGNAQMCVFAVHFADDAFRHVVQQVMQASEWTKRL